MTDDARARVRGVTTRQTLKMKLMMLFQPRHSTTPGARSTLE